MGESQEGCVVFETALGWIGLAWTASGIDYSQLPSADRSKTLARLMAKSRREPAGMPDEVRQLADQLSYYAAGEPIDFRGVVLDLDRVDPFEAAIYARARELGYGETTTYGALAAEAGHPGKARETGQALGANPVPILVPCHRIVAAGGKLGGFSAPGGASTKRRLLEMERAIPPSPAGQSAFTF